MKRSVSSIILYIAIAVMAVSGVLLLSSYLRDFAAMRYWERIASKKETTEAWSGDGILPQYQALYAENPDLVGWLMVEGAHIDYPVMQTKDDPEHYLRLNFNGEFDWSGTPFVDYRCDVLPERSFNTIIYGHNGVFRYLFDYAYKNRRYPEYKYIQFDTLTHEGTYEIVAVFYADATGAQLLTEWDSSDPQAYTFYNYIEVDSPEGFRKFKEYLETSRLYETEAEISIDDHLITLVCCADETFSDIEENGRLIVVAKEVSGR